MPPAASWRMISSSLSLSSRVSAAVGSSMTIIRASRAIARMISTFCCSAVRSAPTRAVGRRRKPVRSLSALKRRRTSPRLTTPAVFDSMPSMTFSSTVAFGTSAISCAIVAIPVASASRGEWKRSGSSSTISSPSSGS